MNEEKLKIVQTNREERQKGKNITTMGTLGHLISAKEKNSTNLS